MRSPFQRAPRLILALLYFVFALEPRQYAAAAGRLNGVPSRFLKPAVEAPVLPASPLVSLPPSLPSQSPIAAGGLPAQVSGVAAAAAPAPAPAAAFQALPDSLPPSGQTGQADAAAAEMAARSKEAFDGAERLRYYASFPFTWLKGAALNGVGIASIVKLLVKPPPSGLLAADHPWASGVDPKTGDHIWNENVVFRTPRKTSWRGDRSLLPDSDEEILKRNGQFLLHFAAPVTSTLKHPFGYPSRMPPGINYLHAAINYNSAILIFNDFQEGIRHFTDPSFVKELKRLAKETDREVMILFRERAYHPLEYANLIGVMRSVLPWFSNANGPRRTERNSEPVPGQKWQDHVVDGNVLWGNTAPYPAVNAINGKWIADVNGFLRARGDAAAMRAFAKEPIAPGRYFQGTYWGVRDQARWPEKLLARVTGRRIRARGAKGNKFFVDQRKLVAPESPSSATIGAGLPAGKESSPVVIIGAGPAGLSLSRELKARGVESLILEKGEQVGWSWKNMPTNLQLLNPWGMLRLPGTPDSIVPKRDRYPAADVYGQYLHRYAAYHGLSVATKTEMARLEPQADGAFMVWTKDGRSLRAQAVVNATGYFSRPLIPAIPGAEGSGIPQLHFAQYKDPEQIREMLGGAGKRIIVVGKRLAAGQAMAELNQAGFTVSLSARGEVDFMPQGLLLRLGERLMPAVEWLGSRLGLGRRGGRPVPMQGGLQRRLIESGQVKVVGPIQRLEPKEAVFADGRREPVDLILFATGFKPALPPMPAELRIDGTTGRPALRGMESADLPGLFFLGLDGQRNWRSRFVRGMREDAGVLAGAIQERLDSQAGGAEAVSSGEFSWPRRTETLRGRKYLVNDLSRHAARADQLFRMSSPFDLSKEVLLAYSPDKLHAFLIVGGQEFHGRMMFRGSRLLPADQKIRALLFLRLKNLPPETVARLSLEAQALKGRRFASCMRALGQALSGAGIRLPPGAAKAFLLRPSLRAILEDGLVDGAGRPIEVELYKTRPQPLSEIDATMGRKDLRYMSLALPMLFIIPLGRLLRRLGLGRLASKLNVPIN